MPGAYEEWLALEAACRQLCRAAAPVADYRWPPRSTPSWRDRLNGVKVVTYNHRAPPLPFMVHRDPGDGHCRVCGGQTYGRRTTDDNHLPAAGRPGMLRWHGVCLSMHNLWTNPPLAWGALLESQGWRCAITGEQLTRASPVEIDHRVPLFRVARLHAALPWPVLLRFWGFENLRAVSVAAHVKKNADEARERAAGTGRDSGKLLAAGPQPRPGQPAGEQPMNDAAPIHTYEGKTVTVVRDAQPGDPGFDATEKQSIVRFEDGTEQAVLSKDIVKS